MRLLDTLRGLRGRRTDGDAVHAVYAATITQARDTGLYTELAVPDTPEGRLEALMLHVYLVLRRLRDAESEAAASGDAGRARAFAQALFDLMFQDLDQNLREMGVGDVSVGKRVKKLAKGFYGRIALYDRALDADATTPPDPLAAALAETVFDPELTETPPPADAAARLAAYVRRQLAALDGRPVSSIVDGQVAFADTVEGSPSQAGVRS